MREILFKAKRIDNGEWICGSYVYTFCEDKIGIVVGVKVEKHWIVEESGNMVWVDKDTICQCTGLKDKNGKLIWENDVVRFKHEKFDFDDGLEPWERSCLPNKKEYTRNYAVEFCNTSTNYGLRFRNKSTWFMVHRMTVVMHDVEVIGNIFDNPELMHE